MRNQHFNVNRALLLAIGLWPYRRSKFVQLQLTLLMSILMTFITFQFGVFFTSRRTADLVLKSLFSVFLFTTVVVLYTPFCANTGTVRTLLDRMEYTYDDLKDEVEIAILEKYWRRSKRFISLCSLFFAFCFFGLILFQFGPRILDIILPLNKSRSLLQLQIEYTVAEYIIDQKIYSYLILLHINVTVIVAMLAALGIGALMLTYNQHICGMLRIASYRLQQAMRINMSRPVNTEKEIFMRIVYAVDIHRKAMQLSDYFMSKFSLLFAFLVAAGVSSISLNLFHIFQNMTSKYNIVELIIYLLILMLQYLFMFVANYVAQEIIDHIDYFFATVYNAHWYITSLNTQKIVLFLLQRGTKDFNLNIGGLFIGSLEGFATLMSATISYFTVIYSTR